MDIPTYILCTKYTDSKIVSSSTIDIGTVTTLEPNNEATVNNSGTSQDAVFDFAIPRGENGQNGLDGKTPVKGVDYNTPEDIKKIVEEVTKNVIDQTAIKPIKTGELISITDSIEYPFVGLTVYGKSTQDGTPSPENPVPIVSAGDSGNITVTVNDGGDAGQPLLLPTPNGLPGVPVDSGGNYTDSSGQQWISDEVDLARGVYVQRVNKFRFSQNMYAQKEIKEKGYGLSMYDRDVGKNNAICTSVIVLPNIRNVYGYAFLQPSGWCIVYDPDFSHWPDADSFKNWAIKNFRAYYQLNTPIETPVPEETLQACRALHTYHPSTNIFGEDNVGLKAQYVADTELFVNNLLADIASLHAVQDAGLGL